jgi:hypothetical protein
LVDIGGEINAAAGGEILFSTIGLQNTASRLFS